jgi:hypothetical protein
MLDHVCTHIGKTCWRINKTKKTRDITSDRSRSPIIRKKKNMIWNTCLQLIHLLNSMSKRIYTYRQTSIKPLVRFVEKRRFLIHHGRSYRRRHGYPWIRAMACRRAVASPAAAVTSPASATMASTAAADHG